MAASLVTYELPWTCVILASTHLYCDKEDPESCIVQWHLAGETLYILLKDKLEIDLRLEREIVDIKVFFHNMIFGDHMIQADVTVPGPKRNSRHLKDSFDFNDNAAVTSLAMGERNRL